MPITYIPFVSPENITAGIVWTLSAGTELLDYELAHLTDGNPQHPLSIAETTIDLRGDQGSATRIDRVVLTMHNFAEDVRLRLQAHADTASWGGTTSVDVEITVPAWLGRFAKHVYFDVATAVPVEATRTKQYLRVTNLDANAAPISIGLITVASLVGRLNRGMRGGLQKAELYGRALNPSRANVASVHDYRTRQRVWSGTIGLGDTDAATLEALEDASYGVRPFLIWPNDGSDEPVYARTVDPIYARQLMFNGLTETAIDLSEIANGEAY